MTRKQVSKQLLASFLRMVNKYNAMERHPVQYGTGPAFYHSERHLLDVFRDHPELNITALAERAGVTKGAISQAVAKRCMIPRRSGKIVNVASVAGLAGTPPGLQTIAYNASKGAAVNFTRALAAEWGRHGINVNAICPGFFPSKMASGILAQIGDQVVARTPLHRLGGEEDLKGAVVFLASEASRHVTGQLLVVDGGAIIA